MRKVTGKEVQGYVSSRVFRGNWVPQRVQNIVIRDYCNNYGFTYLLSATEYGFKDSFMMLSSILMADQEIGGVVFYSMLQLPLDQTLREQLYANARQQKKTLHFALEEKTIVGGCQSPEIEEILTVNDLMPKALSLADYQNLIR